MTVRIGSWQMVSELSFSWKCDCQPLLEKNPYNLTKFKKMVSLVGMINLFSKQILTTLRSSKRHIPIIEMRSWQMVSKSCPNRKCISSWVSWSHNYLLDFHASTYHCGQVPTPTIHIFSAFCSLPLSYGACDQLDWPTRLTTVLWG